MLHGIPRNIVTNEDGAEFVQQYTGHCIASLEIVVFEIGQVLVYNYLKDLLILTGR